MKPATRQIIQALANLENDTDFKIIVQWFQDSADNEDIILRSAESPCIMHRAQGACKTLLKIIEMVDDSRQNVAKMRKISQV